MKTLDVVQGTDEWKKARLGKVTGTRLKSAVGSRSVQETLIYELIAEELSGEIEDLYQSDAMKWGTDHEDGAVFFYEKRYGIKTERVGFCLSDEYDFLALSPDRLVKKGKKYVGAVEVKCPTTKVFIKYVSKGAVPTEYKWQVVNYFLVCPDLQWLDFVIYDPRIPGGMYVVRVTREEMNEYIDLAERSLESFAERWGQMRESVIHNLGLDGKGKGSKV